MAYVVAADFRTATLAEYCQGLSLTTAEVSDANLTAGIARVSTRFDRLTDDHFESRTDTFDIDVSRYSTSLVLPARCTAVTTVKTRAADSTLTTQSNTPTPRWRLDGSLDSTGSYRQFGDTDTLEIIADESGGIGLAGVLDPWVWPVGALRVQVVGTFGWTVTPAEVKRAVALMVYYHFKPIRADLRMAESATTGELSVRFGLTYPTGIPEADDTIMEYTRKAYF